MKALVLSDLWPPFPGGAERLMFNIARHLARTMDVSVLTGYEHARCFDGPTVATAPIGVFGARDEGAAIVVATIEHHRPDVIVAHHLYAREFAPELEASGIPVVHVVLNGGRLGWAALGVFISAWVAGHAEPGPADGDMIITPPALDDVVADEHGTAIGFIKPLPHKGAELVYQVAKRMPARRFVVLRGEWQTLEVIHRLPNVVFMEPVADIRDFWRRVRIVMMPSLSEDAGTVAQEAAANGVPCLSTAVGGLAETNAAGVLLPGDDWRAWARAIRRLDSRTAYDAVVDAQRAHLARTDHLGLLDLLAERIAAL